MYVYVNMQHGRTQPNHRCLPDAPSELAGPSPAAVTADRTLSLLSGKERLCLMRTQPRADALGATGEPRLFRRARRPRRSRPTVRRMPPCAAFGSLANAGTRRRRRGRPTDLRVLCVCVCVCAYIAGLPWLRTRRAAAQPRPAPAQRRPRVTAAAARVQPCEALSQSVAYSIRAEQHGHAARDGSLQHGDSARAFREGARARSASGRRGRVGVWPSESSRRVLSGEGRGC
jgi:hypothetical protein